jgi:carbon monoxide dehydrogenase subunit G
MQLSGKHVVNVIPLMVWEMLMDTDILSRIMPGITRLEKIGDNKFKAILNIKLGPVQSSFAGNLELDEIQEGEAFTLKVQQTSTIGNANAIIQISLQQIKTDQTELAFTGDVKLSGKLAGMGQRLIGVISSTLTKQFFSNLDKELEKVVANKS